MAALSRAQMLKLFDAAIVKTEAKLKAEIDEAISGYKGRLVTEADFASFQAQISAFLSMRAATLVAMDLIDVIDANNRAMEAGSE